MVPVGDLGQRCFIVSRLLVCLIPNLYGHTGQFVQALHRRPALWRQIKADVIGYRHGQASLSNHDRHDMPVPNRNKLQAVGSKLVLSISGGPGGAGGKGNAHATFGNAG